VEKEKFTVKFESLSETDAPMTITQSEFMRRMKEQQMAGGGGMMMGMMPDMFDIVVNSNHPLIVKIAEEKTKKNREKLIKQTVDLALLSQGMLKGKSLTSFIDRSLELID